jgi:outer membrane protein assembly factor BamB
MKNKIINIVVSMLLFSATILSVAGSVNIVNTDAEKQRIVDFQRVSYENSNSDWPMFHHDPENTGYSPSFAPNTNTTLWNFTTGGGVTSSPAVVNGNVYFGSYDGKMYCVDAETGGEIWNHSTGNRIYGGPAVVDDRVYIGEYLSPKILCLDATTGDEIWNYTTASTTGTQSSPTIVDGYLYIGSMDNNMYCLDADTGDKIWNFTAGRISSSPALTNGKVYFGSMDKYVYCLNSTTGAFIWSVPTDGSVLSSPAIAEDFLYIGSGDYNVYCFDVNSGDQIWNYTTGGSVGCCPAVFDEKIFVAVADANVYCLDAENGDKIWNYTMGSMTYSSPGIADGKLYVGSNDNKFYCLDVATGELIWTYATGHTLSRGSPAIADGKVFMGSYDQNMYAFKDPLELDFKGGILSIKVDINNTGNQDFTNANYSIHVTGGIFNMIDVLAEDVIDIDQGDTVTVKASPVFGLGKITVSATVTLPDIGTITRTADGFVLFFLVIVP